MVRVGVYVLDVSGVNFGEHQVRVDFYAWFVFSEAPGSKCDPAATFRLVNATEFAMERRETEARGSLRRQLIRCTATVKKNWTVADYPFDDHTVRLYLEDTGGLEYVPDTAPSGMTPGLNIPGWDVSPLTLTAERKIWPTSLGALSGATQTERSRLQVAFKINRRDRLFAGLGLFIEVFTGVMVSLFIAWLALWVPARELEVRAGLTVGALFAVVGSQISLASSLPPSSSMTLVDAWHLGSYAFVAVMVCLSVWAFGQAHAADHARADEDEALAEKIDARAERLHRMARVILSFSWLLIMVVVTLSFMLANPGTNPHY